MSFLHSDVFLKSMAALTAVAVVVKALAPPNTIAHHVADWVIQGGVTLGIGSTVGREPKA